MATVKLKNVRLAFPVLWEPRAFEEGGAKKYGATILIPKNSPYVAEINKTIKTVAKEKWGAKSEAIVKSIEGNALKYCFLDGDLKDKYEGFEGHYYLSAKATVRPNVRDKDNSPLSAEDGKPYGGCYVFVIIDIYVQDNKWGKAIRAGLKGIQFYRDGDAFAAGMPAKDEDFEDLSEGATDDEVA